MGDFIARHCPEAPVGFLNRLLRQGFVQIDGRPAERSERLRPGCRVALFLPEGSFLVAPNPDVPFDVVHEDSQIIVVSKPAGVITEPGIGHKLDTLLNGLVARYGEELDRLGPENDFGLAHRLDKETSGLLVAARSAEAHGKLRAQFRRREVKKRYLALVAGRLDKEAGVIRIPLGRVRRGGHAEPVTQGPAAQEAVTAWRVIEKVSDTFSLVEAMPRTGRWRQIRLHFQAIGHPVAGDADHGDAQANATLAEQAGLQRLFLHAACLAFRHPADGRAMEFTLPLPRELEGVLTRLRAG